MTVYKILRIYSKINNSTEYYDQNDIKNCRTSNNNEAVVRLLIMKTLR